MCPTVEKVTVKKVGRKHIYVHNDLSNAAHYFRGIIRSKIADDEREGIAHVKLACMIFLAFEFEAELNFLGNQIIKEWDEWQSFKKKLNQVLSKLTVKPNWNG